MFFHGTLTTNVDNILRDGLRPRGSSASHDEYLGNPSLPEFVYLTTSLGLAVDHSVRISERVHRGAPVTILAVVNSALEPELFYPDEDWLRTEVNSDFTDWTRAKQMKFMKEHRVDWPQCLKEMRTVAYHGQIAGNAIIPLHDEMSGDEFIEDARHRWQNRIKVEERD
jgi:hypothetical protein